MIAFMFHVLSNSSRFFFVFCFFHSHSLIQLKKSVRVDNYNVLKLVFWLVEHVKIATNYTSLLCFIDSELFHLRTANEIPNPVRDAPPVQIV